MHEGFKKVLLFLKLEFVRFHHIAIYQMPFSLFPETTAAQLVDAGTLYHSVKKRTRLIAQRHHKPTLDILVPQACKNTADHIACLLGISQH